MKKSECVYSVCLSRKKSANEDLSLINISAPKLQSADNSNLLFFLGWQHRMFNYFREP